MRRRPSGPAPKDEHGKECTWSAADGKWYDSCKQPHVVLRNAKRQRARAAAPLPRGRRPTSQKAVCNRDHFCLSTGSCMYLPGNEPTGMPDMFCCKYHQERYYDPDLGVDQWKKQVTDADDARAELAYLEY